MTTPTREQVGYASTKETFRLLDEVGVVDKEYTDCNMVYTTTLDQQRKLVALADLEATIAEQAAEIERCKQIDANVLVSLDKEINELRQQLAASQAYAEQIREALEETNNLLKYALQALGPSGLTVIGTAGPRITAAQALALPNDTTALLEHDAKLVERITQFCVDVVELYDDATMQSDYMIDSSDCHDILIALAPYIADKTRKGEF